MKKLMSIMLVVVMGALVISTSSCSKGGDASSPAKKEAEVPAVSSTKSDSALIYAEKEAQILNAVGNLPAQIHVFYADKVKVEGNNVVLNYSTDDPVMVARLKEVAANPALQAEVIAEAFVGLEQSTGEEREAIVKMAQGGYGFRYTYNYDGESHSLVIAPADLLKRLDNKKNQ